ncbi:MAG: Ppx/GppA family phosphatase, partial [Erysipelotrichia bacterium]|nr:Ppx/GppA family phosphatase [Erysipelotrichia bacterium]
IGGGSTELSFVKNGKIEKSISLNIGTVRIKELYFNKNNTEGAKNYILDNLKKIFELDIEIPKKVVGIGGSIRALSKIVMAKKEYPLDILHGFAYDVKDELSFFDRISRAKDNDDLKSFGVKKDRFDTIKEGSFIFKTILEELKINEVVTSGVGVREGVYLTDLLRNSNHKFPENFNVSVRSLLDRFQIDEKQSAYLGNNAKKIFDALKPLHNLDNKYRGLLVIASKLHSIGSTLNFYKSNDNAFDFILNGLNYDFLHTSRVVVAYTIKFSKKSLPTRSDILEYEELLPSLKIMQWMSFMISLNFAVNQDFSRPKVEYFLNDETLEINLSNKSFLIESNIDKLETPEDLTIKIL